jgi:hypothetical protein
MPQLSLRLPAEQRWRKSTVLLSLRNRLTVALCPTHIAVSESGRGWRPQSTKPVAFAVEPVGDGEPDWQPAVTALGQWLAQRKRGAADIDVVVSDSFARYGLMSWSDDVQKASEVAALSHIQFEALFGAQAAEWEIRIDRSKYQQPGVCCALDKTLMAQLQGLFATHKLRLTSLQPYFIRACNRWRARLGRDVLFAVIESSQCVLTTFKNGAWHSVRTVRLGPDPAAELPVLIEREILLQGVSEQAPVYLHTLEPLAALRLRQERRVNLLEVSAFAKGQSAGVAMILGGVA